MARNGIEMLERILRRACTVVLYCTVLYCTLGFDRCLADGQWFDRDGRRQSGNYREITSTNN